MKIAILAACVYGMGLLVKTYLHPSFYVCILKLVIRDEHGYLRGGDDRMYEVRALIRENMACLYRNA